MEENKERLIETLIRGRDSASRLQKLLRRKVNVDGSVLVKDLLTEILESFSGGLSMLNSSDSAEICAVPASPGQVLGFPVIQIPDVLTGKRPVPPVKERRGCYKRRRTVDSRVTISSTTEDGYAWRKYGQKEILNSKFPRCYFRCTHKHFHGCKAVKQVQKQEDESNMFHITYFGHHTCPPPDHTLTHHEVVLAFETSKNHNLFPNSPSAIHIEPTVKQEAESKDQSTDVSDNISSGNDDHSSSALRWNEILRGDHLGSCHQDGSFMRFDHEDSCASTSSNAYFNMDFLNNGDLLSDILFDGVFS
ncbi:WRKY DNA-binding transcription factor 70-like [Bidens hawaiensis]|uniref:WRKY DNA-binding transcription factor 70-like n=1 Tax=Bidens hawaiensis TaxID=980011 RepID=UPI00404A1B7F